MLGHRQFLHTEELPCLDSPDNEIPNGLDKIMPAVEKDDKEITQVEDAVPSQSSIFDFLNGDVCQLLIFFVDFDLGSEKMDSSDLDAYEILSKHLLLLDLNSSSGGSACLDDKRHSVQDNEVSSIVSTELQLTDHKAKVNDDVESMITDAIMKDYGFSGEIDENILYSPFHHWHKMLKDDPLSDRVEIYKPHQCYGSENCSGMLPNLNCDAGIFEQAFKFALENYGFVVGNYHEETVAGTPMLLSSSESLVLSLVYSQFDEELNKNCVSTSTYAQSFASFSHSQMEWFMGIHSNTTSYCGITDSSNDCETSGQPSSEEFGTLEQHPAIRNTKNLKFSIPDPDELMKYLYDTISSPKFLASDPSNGGSDNSQFLSLVGNHNWDEFAKSDNLSGFIINKPSENYENDNEDGILDSFDLANEFEIGAMTAAFGEIETPDIPSLPDTSDIEKIRWNWCSRDVYSSIFNLSDHHDLLELYGLNEQDVNAFDDYFCESPTWPEEKHIQESELCYIKSTSTSTHHHSFDTVSDHKIECTMEIHKETISLCGNTDSLNDCGTSRQSSSEMLRTLEQRLATGNTEEFKFSIPDLDELMDYLHGDLNSPKFLTSIRLNDESDLNDEAHFLLLPGIRNSDEVAKSDNLSDSTTNAYFAAGVNDNKYGIFDTFGYATEPGIGAITGGFGEIEKIRWNWSSRKVNFSAFDFDDHQDLLELYGLSEQDFQVENDELLDSPTWPRKQ